MILSTLTGKHYDEKDAVRIVNSKQAAFYWKNGARPLSVYPSNDLRTGDPIVVFIFSKSETKELYQKWLDQRPQQVCHD